MGGAEEGNNGPLLLSLISAAAAAGSEVAPFAFARASAEEDDEAISLASPSATWLSSLLPLILAASAVGALVFAVAHSAFAAASSDAGVLGHGNKYTAPVWVCAWFFELSLRCQQKADLNVFK